MPISNFKRAVEPGFIHAILCAIAIGTVAHANAQDSIIRSVDRAELLRTGQPTAPDSTEEGSPSDSEQIAASPNDPDLGEQAILKRSTRYEAWTFYAAIPVSYTSNVALSRTNEQDDLLFTPSVGLTFAPRLARNLYGNISVGQQFFYYDRFDDLDFGSFDARAGLSYSLPQWHNLILRADYAFNRLTSGDGLDNAFFTNHSLNLGAEVPFRFGRAQQLSLGVDLSFNLEADPEPPGRHDYSAFAAYSFLLTRSFSASAVARVAVRDYVETDRTDVSGIFAVSANYRLTKWLSANASANYVVNRSNQEVFDYDVANVGAALSLVFRF